MSKSESASRTGQQTYRYVSACKSCGIIGDEELPEEVAENLDEDMDNIAFEHYDETGHTVLRAKYTNAPDEIQEMLEADRVEQIDFRKLAAYVSN